MVKLGCDFIVTHLKVTILNLSLCLKTVAFGYPTVTYNNQLSSINIQTNQILPAIRTHLTLRSFLDSCYLRFI